MPKKIYSIEFKQKAVDLVKVSGVKREQVCKDLGISMSALNKWCSQFGISSASGSEPLTASERDELNRLRRETLRLQQECDFLKKTANYFAKSPV